MQEPSGQQATGLSDLDRLRQEYPAWRFGAQWTGAASGPDRRMLWAFRPEDRNSLVTAWSADALRVRIQEMSAREP